MSWTFDRTAIRAFRFTSKRFDAATGEIALGYAFVNHDGETSPELIERITVPTTRPRTSSPAFTKTDLASSPTATA